MRSLMLVLESGPQGRFRGLLGTPYQEFVPTGFVIQEKEIPAGGGRFAPCRAGILRSGNAGEFRETGVCGNERECGGGLPLCGIMCRVGFCPWVKFCTCLGMWGRAWFLLARNPEGPEGRFPREAL